jgi:hypothetical protein
MRYRLIFIFLLFQLAGTASADCIYNGDVYPEGTVIGPYVCAENGWANK